METEYLGLDLKNPLVPSASPLSSEIDKVRQMEDAGADVTMVASVLLQKGIEVISPLLQEVSEWMEENEYQSVSEMKGAMSSASVADASAFERANYIRILQGYDMNTI